MRPKELKTMDIPPGEGLRLAVAALQAGCGSTRHDQERPYGCCHSSRCRESIAGKMAPSGDRLED